VVDASQQIDLYDPDIVNVWKSKIAFVTPDAGLLQESDRLRKLIQTNLNTQSEARRLVLDQVNKSSEQLNLFVEKQTARWLAEDKRVVLLGGDHSTPLGYWRALEKKYRSFGILHIDAHADLRKAYEGFTFSHGSVFYHAWRMQGISKIVQVGVRDYCEEESERIRNANGRIATFFYHDLREDQFNGTAWAKQVEQIISLLPEEVHISLDVDGLDPALCPNTGTPVPGGFRFEEITYLIKQLVRSGRKIIGADLVETGAAPWDAMVAARLLFLLCTWMPHSHTAQYR
jgi:agmatinase